MTTEPQQAPPAKPARSRRWRLGLTLTVLPASVLGALVVGTTWLLKDPGGSAWLLRQVPGLTVDAPHGSLLGDFAARRVVYQLPGGKDHITIDGLQWQDLTLSWSESPRLWGRLGAKRLHADAVDVATAPSTTKSKAPTGLGVPLGLRIGQLEVDRLSLSALAGKPLLGLRGSLDLSAEGGSVHRLSVDALQWEQLRLAGKASIETQGAMKVTADLQLQPEVNPAGRPDLPDWRGGLQLTGPLLDLQAQAQLQAAGQSLQAQAQLQPFMPWPLAAFKASFENLDLSALVKDLPRTALSGGAELQSRGWSEPAELQLQLGNAAAGRWDQQRLPVQHLKLALQARPDQPDSLRLSALDALLGSPGKPGGSIVGQGELHQDQGWKLTARLSGLRPEALDARAAAMLLAGTLELSGAPKAALDVTANLSGSVPTGKTSTPLTAKLQASLQGQRLHLSHAELLSGQASLGLSGEASVEPGGWKAAAQAQLQDFDPHLLWAGAPGSAWQRAGKTTALNATAAVQLQEDKARLPRGSVQMSLRPSQLMGLALTGKLDYVHAAGSDASLTLQIDAGEDNKLLAVSHMPDAAPGIFSASSQLEIQAPQLDKLSPVLALLTSAGARISGAAEGKIGLQLQHGERWQASSDGSLSLRKLSLTGATSSPVTLREGKLRWVLGSTLDKPLALGAELDRLGAGGQLLTQASVDLQGSWASHRLKLDLQAQPARGPAAQASLALNGELSSEPMRALQDLTPLLWKGHLSQLQVQAIPGSPDAAHPPPFLKTGDLDLQMQASAAQGVTSASAAPGRLELAGAQVRWTELQWQAPLSQGERANMRAEIQLEPLAVAPLLARWQPDFGWGGPLVITGHASVRTNPQLGIEAVIERSQGDLTVTDERGPQALGLTDLRIGLTAQDGLWQFTQALAGTAMGSLGGAVSVHADRNALWPDPKSKIDGVLQANVARLGTWGAWVPAGWRLGGSLAAGVQIAGTLDGPELLGQAKGADISLRNPLLGVDLTDGAFNLSLDGATARLNSLSAKGGKGELSAQGEARLGEQATAQLKLKADHFVLLNRVDRRLVASGQAALDLGPQLLKLDGSFMVDEGLFDITRGGAPSLDDDVLVVRADQPPVDTSKPAAKVSERKTRIALAINLGEDLKVRGHGLDSRLHGELKLTQTDNAPPALTGTVSTSGGTYAAYGQKLEVERGEISFTGAFDNPRLDVLAIRPDTDTRVGVAVTGTALAPRIKLFSDPDMADTDKLSWLLLGRGPDGLGRTDTALLQRAALALLSGEGESTSGKIIKNIGLDELSLGQGDDSTQGTIVRLGKQLSRRWYVGYERSLNATTGSWQLIYRIAQRFTLRAQTGEDNALDLIWQWKWQ